MDNLKAEKKVSAWPDRFTSVGFRFSNNKDKATVTAKDGKTILYLDSSKRVTHVYFEEVDTEGEQRKLVLNGLEIKLTVKNMKSEVVIKECA